MNWYKKSMRTYPHETQEYSYAGFTFFGEITGIYHPATEHDPAEFPEVELVNAKIEDIEALWDYIDWFSNDFVQRVNEEIASRTSHFGTMDEPITFIFNGIEFIIKVPSLSDSGTWTIIDAKIVDSDKFLSSLPENIKEHVSNQILERADG